MTDLAQTFGDLVRYETRLYNALGDRLQAEHGIGTSQYEFLRLIGSRDDCRVVDVAHEVAVAVGAISKGIDRLEAAGWVSRRPNPANRRSSLLSLTEAGRKLLDEATVTFEAGLTTWMAEPLTGAALDQLAAALAVLRKTVQDARAGTPTG